MESSAPDIEVRLLGPVELRRQGREVAIGGPRQRALLALLGVRAGQVVPGDELVDEIWAGEPTGAAETTLRSYVSRLRASLDGMAAIERTDRGYMLDVPAPAVDALRFEALVRDAVAALDRGAAGRARDGFVEALQLWRGRPFGDVGNEGALGVAAERLEEIRLLALERRMEAELALGRAAELVDELEGLVRTHPFRERLWEHLMLALYRAGRQADALAAYHRAREQLDEHLGIEPGEALRALEAAILNHTVPAPAAIKDRPPLPVPVSSFVGRAEELRELEERISRERLVTLTGVGGVGKTRLALEVARRLSGEIRDGVVFVDLSPLADPALVPGQVAGALGLREQADADLVDVLAAHLRESELLLVIDNCEHLREAAAALVQRLLLAARGVRILATSRAPLGVPGEAEAPIAPLQLGPAPSELGGARSPDAGRQPGPSLGPSHLALPDAGPSDAGPSHIGPSDAVQLFLARAREARPSVGHDPATLAVAARICADLEGLPLAIELAAARARSLSLDEIAARLDDRFRFLISWRRLTTARHRTLREAMDWSHELLPPEEQDLLARLSVFAGGFALEAVATVCTGGDDEAALTRIEGLVGASLVIAEDGPGETRYRLLETVRQYAARRLDELGAAGEQRAAAASWALELAEAAAPELGGERQGWWFARLEAEHNNLRAALAWFAEAGRQVEHLRLAIALTRFWYVRGHLAEGRTHLDQALAGDEARDPVLRRRALTAAASLALLQGDHPRAIALAEEGLVVARASGTAHLVANALSNLGAIVLAGGQVDRAGPLLDEAVRVAREAGDARILALAVNNLGDYALTRGNHERARPLFEESLVLLRARGDTSNVARALFNLGASELELGRLDIAGEHFREGLGLARDAGDREDQAWLLEGLAALAAARADPERGALLLGAASALLAAMGADHKPFEQGLRDRTEAAIRAQLGDPAAAEALERGAAATPGEAIELALAPDA